MAPFTPRLDGMDGGSRVMAELLRQQCMRHTVALVHLRGADESPLALELRDICALVRDVPHRHPRGLRRVLKRARVAGTALLGMPVWAAWWSVPKFAECVAQVAAEWSPDLIQLEYSIMGQYAGAVMKCPAPRVLVEHDATIGNNAASDEGSSVFRQLVAALDRRAWRRYRTDVLRQVDAAVVFTERDRVTLEPLAGETPVVSIPLGATLPRSPMSAVGDPDPSLLFVGSFRHLPNVDAALRLRDSILPMVRAGISATRLVLVGTHPTAELRRPVGPHVELAEAVPDVGPYLNRASVVVAPLRLGGGMRVKVLESLAAGKAVVASRLAIEGLDLRDGVECCLAESDGEFAEQVLWLLGDRERRRRLGTQARAWAEKYLSWSRTLDSYERLYDRLIQYATRT